MIHNLFAVPQVWNRFKSIGKLAKHKNSIKFQGQTRFFVIQNNEKSEAICPLNTFCDLEET